MLLFLRRCSSFQPHVHRPSRAFGIFNRGYSFFKLRKPLKNLCSSDCLLSKISTKISKVSVTFFHSLIKVCCIHAVLSGLHFYGYVKIANGTHAAVEVRASSSGVISQSIRKLFDHMSYYGTNEEARPHWVRCIKLRQTETWHKETLNWWNLWRRNVTIGRNSCNRVLIEKLWTYLPSIIPTWWPFWLMRPKLHYSNLS
jgi:hypothetical protein